MSQTPDLTVNYASIPNAPGKLGTPEPINAAVLSTWANQYGGGLGGQNHPQVSGAKSTSTTVGAKGGVGNDQPIAIKVTAPTNKQPATWWTT